MCFADGDTFPRVAEAYSGKPTTADDINVIRT